MIKYKYEGKEYLLEYDRASVEIIEKLGFKISEYTNNMATMQPILFSGAFFKHHRAERLDYDKMWESVVNKRGLTNALLDMVATTYQTLLGKEEEQEGNENWEVM